VVLKVSSGDEMPMLVGIQGYSFAMLTDTWWETVGCTVASRARLLRQGWLEREEHFGKLAMRRSVWIMMGRVSGVVRAAQWTK